MFRRIREHMARSKERSRRIDDNVRRQSEREAMLAERRTHHAQR